MNIASSSCAAARMVATATATTALAMSAVRIARGGRTIRRCRPVEPNLVEADSIDKSLTAYERNYDNGMDCRTTTGQRPIRSTNAVWLAICTVWRMVDSGGNRSKLLRWRLVLSTIVDLRLRLSAPQARRLAQVLKQR